MKQVLLRRAGCVIGTTDSFMSFPMDGVIQSADLSRTPIPATGTFGKMYVQIDVAPGVGTSRTFTLFINGIATACAVTISDAATTGQYTGAAVPVSSGDYAYIGFTHSGATASIANASFSYEFTSTNARQSIHCGGAIPLTSTVPRWHEALNPNAFVNTTALVQSNCVVSAPGSITAMYFSIGAAAGTTGSYTATIYKNGVAQDGTGGTPDTHITITNVITRVDSSAAFTLNVVAGDLLAIQIDGASSPSSKTAALALRFVATNDGESNLSFCVPSIPSSVGVNSFNTVRGGSQTWSSVTARANYIASKFKLKNFYVYLTAAPAGVTSRTFISINNGSAGSNSVTVTGASTTGSDTTHQETYNAAGDTFDINESAISGSPAASLGSFGFTMFIQPGGNAGKGDSGNKAGGGALNRIQPGGALLMNIGNAGLDIVSD